LELTLSEGIISGLREYEGGHVLQTSAAISPGSSGGGLFDAQGRLVGITTFFLSKGQNLNFALPAEWVQALLEVRRARDFESLVNRPLPAEKYEKLFRSSEIVLHNIAAFEAGGLLDSDPDMADSAASASWDALVDCLRDEKSKDCTSNWPSWQRASFLMLELRQKMEGLPPGRGGVDVDHVKFERSILEVARSKWSDVSDVYCEARPGGLYTDLEDKIRACPRPH